MYCNSNERKLHPRILHENSTLFLANLTKLYRSRRFHSSKRRGFSRYTENRQMFYFLKKSAGPSTFL